VRAALCGAPRQRIELIVPTPPLVSVCIPLHRSARFVDRIVGNIAAIDYPRVDILVSDRHGDDDALSTIRGRLRGDVRVRTVQAADRLSWLQHYNWLLREAHGDYVMWMPHDDEFPGDYVSRLAAALDAAPDAVLAYGRIVRVDLAGNPLVPAMNPPPAAPPDPWTPAAAAGMLIRRETEEPFRGLFRRDVALRSGLMIRPTLDAMSEDAYWVFGLALLGRFVLVAGCTCRKAYYPASTHARWGPMRLKHIVDGRRVLRVYVRNAPLGPDECSVLNAGIDRWAIHAMTGVVARTVGVPPGMRRRAQRLLSRAVSGRAPSPSPSRSGPAAR
jgi:glycosyltransferase involved in cell wall biosynthesis